MSGHKPSGRHQEKRLTVTSIRAAKEPGLYGDGHGLYLRVDASGAKRWIQRIVIQGKRRDIGLGSANLVTLAEAREKALQQRKLARAGEDPLAARMRSEAIPSFEKAARSVHEHREGSWKNEKHRKQWLSSLERYAFPKIGTKRIDKVESADVLLALDEVWTSRPETARRIKQRIGMVLKWAIARGYRIDNPAEVVQQALSKHDRSQIKRMRSMPHRDVPSAISKIKASSALDATKLALQMIVYTACRSGEVRGALWSEIDLEAAVWLVPASRMKMKRPHKVPLNRCAIAVLEAAKAIRRADTNLVFPNSRGAPLSDSTLSKLMRELELGAVPHGFRSTFRDWAAEETNHSNDTVEFSLAHTVQNKVEAAYFRSDLFDRRKKLMDEWCIYLSGTFAEKV